MRRHGWDSRRRKGGEFAPASSSDTRSEEEQVAPHDEAPLRGPKISPPPPASGPPSPVSGQAGRSDPVQDVDIPELRKKENERKGIGAYWSGASPGSGSLLARAATGGGYSSPFGLGRIAAALAQRIGAQTALGQLLLGKAGGWLLLSGIIGGGVMVGIMAGLLARNNQPQARGRAPMQLESPRSGIIVNSPRDKSLSTLQAANEGEITFDDRRPPPPTPAEAGGVADAATDEQAQGQAGEPPLTAEGIADSVGATAAEGGGSSGKLAELRGALASAGGGFGGGAGALKGLERQLKTGLPGKDKNWGKSAKFARNRPLTKSGAGLSTARGRTNKAMGQLKLSNFMSRSARSMAGEEGSSQFATNAFEQSKTQGGEVPEMIGAAGTPQVVVPPGSGAPDMTQTPTVPPVGPEVNATPYQPALDAAFNMGAAAGMMKMMGMLMMAIGAGLIAYGISMTPVGWGWIAAGVAMVGMGVMMLAQAQGMAKQAKAMGDAIKAQDQTQQGQIATDSAQAKADGRDYTPPDMTDKTKRNDEVKQTVEEQQNATYQFDGDKPRQ